MLCNDNNVKVEIIINVVIELGMKPGAPHLSGSGGGLQYAFPRENSFSTCPGVNAVS